MIHYEGTYDQKWGSRAITASRSEKILLKYSCDSPYIVHNIKIGLRQA